MSDIVEWLRDRAFRKCGPTMEAAHTEQQEWIWAEEIERLRAEVEELQKATTPICVGRGVIGKMAKDGSWTSENGASVVAADELFRNDPYEQIDDLLASLKEAHELLHKLTAIIPGNDEAGKEAAKLLARIRAERSWC